MARHQFSSTCTTTERGRPFFIDYYDLDNYSKLLEVKKQALATILATGK